jgi:hypothetical protein
MSPFSSISSPPAPPLSRRASTEPGARIRQAAIERDARRALPGPTVERLERIGVLSLADLRAERREVAELVASLTALRELQTWAENRLADTQAECYPGPAEPEPFGPPRAA